MSLHISPLSHKNPRRNMQIIYQFTSQKASRSYIEKEPFKFFSPLCLCSNSSCLLECSLLTSSSLLTPHLQHPHITPFHQGCTHTSYYSIRVQASPTSTQSMAGQFPFLLLPTISNLLTPILTQNIHRTVPNPSLHGIFDVQLCAMVRCVHVLLVSSGRG